MSSVSIAGDTSGSVALTAATVAGSTAITIAAQSGTLNVGGPAFSYTNSTGTVIPSGTWTKIAYDTKRFDTTSSMYSTANSRFTPTVAGYYQITGNFRLGSLTAAVVSGGIYQNGILVFNGVGSASSSYFGPVVTTLLYFNGSTDYVEIWGFQNSGSSQTTDAAVYYSFSGALVRTA